MKNWRTTLTGSAAAIMGTLTILAALPYDSGLQIIGEVFGQDARDWILKVGLVSALVLRVINSSQTADAKAVQPIADLLNMEPLHKE